MPDTSVKWLHNGMTGAPTLSFVAGNLISVLDACLVNGWGTNTVDSIVVNNNVATVTRAAGHPFEPDMVVEISGATPAGLNGQKKVVSVVGTTYTFDATGISNQTATGTISHKVAPAGWTKSFTGTNKAAYKSPNVAATGHFVRVDDTGTTNARVVGYESMSDVDTGTGPFPTAAQQSGGGYWPKANATGSNRNWVMFADDRFFMLFVAHNSNFPTQQYTCLAFGDFVPTKSGDAYASALFFFTSDQSASATGSLSQEMGYQQGMSGFAAYCPRSWSAMGNALALYKAPLGMVHAGTAAQLMSGQNSYSTFPNLADNALYVTQYMLIEGSTLYPIRGYVPGYAYCIQSASGIFSPRDSVPISSGFFAGKNVRAVMPFNGSSQGVGFVDVTGPWR